MAPSPDESLLVLRARADDRAALEALLRRIQAPLRGYLRSLVGPQDADDVLQETLIQVCRKLRWLEEPAAFRPWTYRIASRFAFKHLKQHRRRAGLAAEDDALELLEAAPPPPPGDLDALLTHEALSPASRAVLLLHFREEMTLGEIAVVLEIPLGTVKSRLAFGLKTLRAHIGGVRPKADATPRRP